MNDKFFDLKKEKQDRMINAALQVFAIHGYKQASTDEIVKLAGISKGLLFHYFENKLGLYTFVYEYSVKFLQLETTGIMDEKERNFKALMDMRLRVSQQILRNYPYLRLFLDRSHTENMLEALTATQEYKNELTDIENVPVDRAVLSSGMPREKALKILEIVAFTEHCMTERSLHDQSFQPDVFYDDMKEYLDIIL